MSPRFLPNEQSTRIAVAFARQAAKTRGAALCSGCMDVLAVSGVGVAVMSHQHSEHLCTTSPAIAALEDVQFTSGAGPSHDAFRDGRPVYAPRLRQGAASHWPSFMELAAQHGIEAVFAFPLESHGARVGVLTLYQRQPGDLSRNQQRDCVALADVLTETILMMQDRAPADELAAPLEDAVAYRAELYQASGMIAVQLRIPASEAMLRIRAHAFAAGLAVAIVAAEIVAGRLRMADDHDPHKDGR